MGPVLRGMNESWCKSMGIWRDLQQKEWRNNQKNKDVSPMKIRWLVYWSLPEMKPPFLLHGFWTGVCLGQTRHGFSFSCNWIFHSGTHMILRYRNGFHYPYTQKFTIAPSSDAKSQSETSSQPRPDRKLGFLHLRRLRLLSEDPTICWRWFYLWLAGFLTHQHINSIVSYEPKFPNDLTPTSYESLEW